MSNQVNRIDAKFAQLKKSGRKGLITFITAGDPSLKATVDIAVALDRAGSDILELGVPFSDPLADGPVIQKSYQNVLKTGFNVSRTFTLVRELRKKSQIPVVLMLSYNLVYHFGESRFFSDAASAGVDGVIVPDILPEEAAQLKKLAQKHSIAPVFLVAPTTDSKRVKEVAGSSRGFLYYVSRMGITGERGSLSTDIARNLSAIRRIAKMPIGVGFGISNPAQAVSAAKHADAVIIGSAIVKIISGAGSARKAVELASKFAKSVKNALDSAYAKPK